MEINKGDKVRIGSGYQQWIVTTVHTDGITAEVECQMINSKGREVTRVKIIEIDRLAKI